MRFLLSLLQVYIIKCPLQSSGLTGCMDCAHFKRTPLSVGYHLQSVGSLHQIFLYFYILFCIYINSPGGVFYCERAMRKFLGCVFLTICCHYAQSSRILPSTEYSNEPRHGEYSPRPPQWRTKENFWKFYKPEQRRIASRTIQSGHNPTRNNINTNLPWMGELFLFKALCYFY